MKNDHYPMGQAIADYHREGRAARLRVFSPMFDEDEIPVATLFRRLEEMPVVEREALQVATGAILDVGAGAGCHALALQAMEKRVTAIDISPLAVATMRERGVKDVREQDFFTLDGQYDTILMLMNGIGIVGTLSRLPAFFMQVDHLLAPGGQLLCDSSDICYVFEDEDGFIDLTGIDGYYGELTYQMQYRDIKGEPFPWLFIDPETLREQAAAHGFHSDILVRGPHYDYLARLTRKAKQ
ncbi:MAG: methyltransferase domain-containing protein [Muribaculaceae bacterium]|nr:methyltransferase domain-containing protein [Muribaculaceae bacterium]